MDKPVSDAAGGPAGEPRRLLVVSHPSVVSVNQIVYRELARRGWDVTIVVPSRWRHAYSPDTVAPQPLAGMEGALRPTPVLFPGRPQRHIYLARAGAISDAVRPDVAFLEAEPVELLLIGAGELREQLEGQPIPGSRVRVVDDLTHEQMPEGYARLDVLVLPSHTTATWKEQFGRVIVEALWCGVPVVGSDSG